MLKNLDEGDYVITSIGYYYSNACYTFRKARGRKRVCCHFANDVDRCIRPANDPDLNRIEILAVGEYKTVLAATAPAGFPLDFSTAHGMIE